MARPWSPVPASPSRWALMHNVERLGWYPTSGYVLPPIGSNPYGIEGYKTIAYEVAEDLGWQAPDGIVVPSAYSDGLIGIWKRMRDLQRLGWIKDLPRMVAAEPFGPLAHALDRGLEHPEAVKGGHWWPSPSRRATAPSGPHRAARVARDRYPDHGRGHLRGAARARARGGNLRRAVLGHGADGRAPAPGPARPRSRRADRPRPDLGWAQEPGASRTWMPEVPAAPDNLDGVLGVLRESYGLDLGG